VGKNQYREHLESIFRAGLEAVDPMEAVAGAVSRDGGGLLVSGRSYRLEDYERIFVIGAGKAGAPMAAAMEEILGDRLTTGRITVKYGHTVPLEKVETKEAGHPIPDEAGIAGAEEIARISNQAGERDLVFCLISGGGSALLVSPAEGITLQQKQAVTSELLACGASIEEINTVRKHLSRVKGGQLARACWPATVVTLILSDVVGDPLDVIASGPTVPDSSTFGECLEIVSRYELAGRLPASVMQRIEAGAKGDLPETPKEGEKIFERVQNEIVGNSLSAVLAASRKAESLGYTPLILSTRIEGETREVAHVHAAIFREVLATGFPLAPPACILSGGETTVTLRGKGKGGRNQEFSLAVALHIQGEDRIFFLSGGTDGTDGPTDAAGAFADGTTVERARALNLEAVRTLDENDSYPFFDALGDLLITGPTNTNVMDLRICLIV
jgi:hydroxypyruvate reductase